MRRNSIPLVALALSFGCLHLSCSQNNGLTEISMADLRDKIEGGWAGQMIGVSFGAPTEFRYQERIMPEGELPEWSKERLQNSIHQDDLYVEMTFAQVLDDVGLDASTEDFAEMFKGAKYSLWHANLGARRALRRGIAPGDSGSPQFNIHANDIDFQIEADFIGLMSPGMPVASNRLAWRAGRVMNYGDGIYGGMFVSGMYAAAFFEQDVRKVVEAGWACMPAESPYAQVIRNVIDWSAEYPDDWQRVWQLIEEKWNDRDPCSDGALTSFNIDAKLNGAYIALGLLYGNGDFEETMKISTRAGQDSDCNPSNAAGILGVMHGYKGIPEKWKDGIEDVADQKFDYTNYSFRDIVESTLKRAVATAEREGGKVEGDSLWLKVQAPLPAELEIWDDYGSPVERIGTDDARWTWEGPWKKEEAEVWGKAAQLRSTTEKGAIATVSFEGTGAVVVGPYLPDGGTLDVFLDGEFKKTVDAYSDEPHGKGGESIWHVLGLSGGNHTIRLETKGEPYGDSAGSKVVIRDLVVFR